MAIHVQDDEADWLLRDFARRRGLGLTAAIKAAVRDATRFESSKADDFITRVKPVIDRARTRKAQSGLGNHPVNDKAFMDEMWGEPK